MGENPEPGPLGAPLGPYDGWSADYLSGLHGDEVVVTFKGAAEADADLVIPLDVQAAEELGAALVELTTGRRPEWVPDGEPYGS